MSRKTVLIVCCSVLAGAALATAFQLGKALKDSAGEEPRQARPAGEPSPSGGVEARLARLEAEVAKRRDASPAEEEEGAKTAPAPDRIGAVEATLSALQLRVKGLEEDPVARGYSFLESENAEMRREGINALARAARLDPDIRAAIRGLLRDPSARVREQAAQVLGRLGDKESAPQMRALLADADARIRRRAVGALGASGERDAAREIGGLLVSDADDRVRLAAADAIGRLKAPEAAEFLVEALKDRSEDVRGEAIASLGEIGAVGSAPHLMALYEGDPGRHGVRIAIALKALGDPAPIGKEIARLSAVVDSDAEPQARQQAQRDLDVLRRAAAR